MNQSIELWTIGKIEGFSVIHVSLKKSVGKI